MCVCSSVEYDVVALLFNAIRSNAECRVNETFTCFDVEFPVVPRTLQDFVLSVVDEFLPVPFDVRTEATQTNRPRTVRANIAYPVVGPVDVEDADLTSVDLDDLSVTGTDVCHLSNDVSSSCV